MTGLVKRLGSWLEFAGISDKGLQRTRNEDAYFADARGIFVTADGLGGHKFGEIASGLARDVIAQDLLSIGDELAKDPRKILTRAVRKANNQIVSKTEADPRLNGMGTTVVVGYLRNHVFHLANVGDSRAYAIRPPDHIRQLTRDHSFVQELVGLGSIDSAQARNHPMSNILTQSLGQKANLWIDYAEVRVRSEDFLLLCTDGLTEAVSDQEILSVLRKGSALKQMCSELVRMAKASGGNDDVTVILVKQ
jgi:serine/threonine protein phosphatase PrpC